MPLRVAALLPTSRMVSRLDRDFLAGLEGALREYGVSYELIFEPTGNAAIAAPLREKMQRVLVQQRPHVVTSVVGTTILQRVHDIFLDAQTPLIVSDAGADLAPETDDARNAYVFHNSLNVWRSTYALGAWAAEAVGRRAGLAIGFYESGYGVVSAFWKGFASRGGEVVRTVVTHRQSSDEDPSEALTAIAAEQPDFVMGLYSGQSAVTFAAAYARSMLHGRTPLLSSAFVPYVQWLSAMGDSAVGVRTAASFDPTRLGVDISGYARACASGGAHVTSAFALLGYESGQIIAEAVRQIGPVDGELPVAALCNAIARVTVDSPRGRRAIDPATGELPSSDFLAEVRQNGDASPHLETIGPLPLPSTFAADAAEDRRETARSSWMNPYLVT